jgi:hypothetical protein
MNHVSSLLSIAGCDSLITTYLELGDVVNHTIVQNGATLTVNSPQGTFQWLDCSANYAPISGAVQNTYTATTNGSYAVLMNAGGCTDTSDCIVVNLSEISELDINSAFTCYPNPTGGEMNIVFKNSTSEVRFTLFDAFGRTIRELNYSGFERTLFNLDIQDLSPGVYTLNISLNGKQFTERIIKTLSE